MVDTNIQTRLDSQFTAGLSAGFEGNIIVARAYAGVTGGNSFKSFLIFRVERFAMG